MRPPLTALFCSARTPGAAILCAHDKARSLRDNGVTVISGFHSIIEKECFRILLRGQQPIIFCPARSLKGMRLLEVWKKAIVDGRLLIISPFAGVRRVSEAPATQRNQLVAALADGVYIAYTASSDKTELLLESRIKK